MSSEVELRYGTDYVCALAETLFCMECKKLPKQAHHCINCLSVYCYLCVHKSERCPHCHVKYTDKSYLKYYHFGDLHTEFIFSMVNQLLKETSIKMPLLIKKIASQNSYVTKKSNFEMGNSSKQMEAGSSNNDDYLMHIENDPNIINNIVIDQMSNDSDSVVDSSTEDSNNDSLWSPGASPKASNKKLDKKNKIETNEMKVKLTKKAIGQVVQNESHSVCDSIGQSSATNEYIVDGKHTRNVCLNTNKERSVSETQSTNAPNETNRNQTLSAIEDELFGKKTTEMSTTPRTPAHIKYEYVTKTYPNKNRNNSSIIHEKSAASIFDFNQDDEDTNYKSFTRKSIKAETILSKYPLLSKPTQKKKLNEKPDDNEDTETHDKDNDEFEELFKDTIKNEPKTSMKKRNKRMNNDDSIEKANSTKSRNIPIETNTKRTRKQLEYNKNTSEIENLIRNKKFKVNESIENEEISPVENLRNTKKIEDEINKKEIDIILGEYKEINIVTRNTRKRKESENAVPAETHELVKVKTTRTRQARSKLVSECSDGDVSKVEDKTEAAKPKRTRGTPKGTKSTVNKINQDPKTSGNDTKNSTNKDNIPKPLDAVTKNSKVTPKRIPKNRTLKAANISKEDPTSTDSTSTGEFFTPNSSTPASIKATSTPRVETSKGLSTPKTSHTRFKVPEKLTPSGNNSTTPTSVKKNPAKSPATPVTVKKNPTVNAMYKRNMKGETPLHTACKKDANKVLTLLQNDMTPNVKDNAGWTPLHDAVSIGNDAVVKLLLEAGALVNVPGMDNDTPLHLAVRNERPVVAKLLIQYGADVGLRNIHGYKPLDYFDVIGRPDIKSDVLTAQNLPSLSTTPAPPPPSCIDIVLYGDQLDKSQMGLLGQMAKRLSSQDQPVIVSTLLQSNVSLLVVSGTPDRTCTATCNVLRCILSGTRAVDISWVSECIEKGQILPTEPYDIVGTVNHPDARPFQRSMEDKRLMLPGLFNGLQVYLTKPWPSAARLSSDEIRDLLRRGQASLLNREPDPESADDSESTVMYHVRRATHRLWRLSQAIVYPECAAPRRLYNMDHVKALGLDWLCACVERYEIVEPKSPYEE